MDNISQQSDEMEVLGSIFGDQWHIDRETGICSINITKEVKLYITLTANYPSDSLPSYELLAPELSIEQRKLIENKFIELYNIEGEGPLIYQMIMIVEEVVKNMQIKNKDLENVVPPSEVTFQKDLIHLQITHGPIITDRKSVFQGHVCTVKSKQDVSDFMELLLKNRKIAHASHNILAYRISMPNNVLLQDCDDDGENKASARVLELLHNLKLDNVMVVVSRWYGGIHLGADRFRHINNAARQALIEGAYIKS